MTLYIGVDFHPHQQTANWCDTATGEFDSVDLAHDLKAVRKFYESFQEPAIIGIEASTRATWFEKMLSETKHTLLVGNPVLIRKRAISRHKSDRRDAELILTLLMRDEFPAIWRRGAESNAILETLRLRMNLVRQRTQVYNRLHCLAHNAGLPKGRMKTALFQKVIQKLELSETDAMQRLHLFRVLECLNQEITEIEAWLKKKATFDKGVKLLITQAGVGYLTALATVHTLGDLSRFTRLSKQIVAFVGLDPVEESSAGRRRFGNISKSGSSLLRFQLGQAAQIAVRSDVRLKAFYKRLAKKKPKGVAKTATARKLLIKLALMLRDSITAEEFDQRGSKLVCPRSPGSERTVA